MSDLDDLIADLEYAGGAGAAKLATSATTSANVEAATGFRGPQMPGPALQSVLARGTGRANRRSSTDPMAVPRVADNMAADVADQAANLLRGNR